MPDIMQGLMAMLASAGGQQPQAPDVGNAAPQGMPDWLSKRPTTMPDQPAGPATSFNVDSVSSLLRGYGIQFPQHLSDAGPVEKSWIGRGHPGLARGLDNALIAVGSMGPSSLSAGDNISNAVRGVLNIQPYRIGLQQEQLKIPLEMTKAVGEMQMHQAMMNMYLGRGDYYRDVGLARVQDAQAKSSEAETRRMDVEQKGRLGMMNLQLRGADKPFIANDGTVHVFQLDPNTGNPVETATDLNPHTLRTANRGQNDPLYRQTAGLLGLQDAPDPAVDPTGARTFWNKYNDLWKQGKMLGPMAGASAGRDVRDRFAGYTKSVNEQVSTLLKANAPIKEGDYQKEVDKQVAKLRQPDAAGNRMGFREADQKARESIAADQEKKGNFSNTLNILRSQYDVDFTPEQQLQPGNDFASYAKKHGLDVNAGTYDQPGAAPQKSVADQIGEYLLKK